MGNGPTITICDSINTDENRQQTEELRCLDMRYATTRLVGDVPPLNCTGHDSKSKATESLVQGEEYKTEGGLRVRGFYKRSLANKPLITVITVVFNGAATIEDTIQSVIGQFYDNIEYIVIDGGSTDSTLEILKKYEHAIDYWISEKDEGLYDAMNKGIELASGEYVGMLNSDDVFANSDALQYVAENICMSNADAFFACLDIVDRNNLKRVLRRYRVTRLSPLLLRIGIAPPHPTLYCKKSVYEKLGGYNTTYRVAADFEMMIRVLKNDVPWRFLDQVIIKMRTGGISGQGVIGQIRQNLEIVRSCRANKFYSNILLISLKIPFKLLQKIAR